MHSTIINHIVVCSLVLKIIIATFLARQENNYYSLVLPKRLLLIKNVNIVMTLMDSLNVISVNRILYFILLTTW